MIITVNMAYLNLYWYKRTIILLWAWLLLERESTLVRLIASCLCIWWPGSKLRIGQVCRTELNISSSTLVHNRRAISFQLLFVSRYMSKREDHNSYIASGSKSFSRNSGNCVRVSWPWNSLSLSLSEVSQKSYLTSRYLWASYLTERGSDSILRSGRVTKPIRFFNHFSPSQSLLGFSTVECSSTLVLGFGLFFFRRFLSSWAFLASQFLRF